MSSPPSTIRPAFGFWKPLITLNSVVFRENTEGLYVSVGGAFKVGTPDEITKDPQVLSSYLGRTRRAHASA